MHSPLDNTAFADQMAAYNKRRITHMANEHLNFPTEEDKQRLLDVLGKLTDWEFADLHAAIFHLEFQTPAYMPDQHCTTCNEPVPTP